MNTYGERFRLTTYGESHGLAVGGIIDGCPSQLRLDTEAIDRDLQRRRQGAPRQEEDTVEWLSGVMRDGEQQLVTLGTPIAFCIKNKNIRPKDYAVLEHLFRPGHADYTYQQKYGIRDHRGGGRASARETAARVVAGAIAKQLLMPISIEAWPEDVPSQIPENDTIGGTVKCRVCGLPAGVGEPLFNKLNASLAAAVMSIPSAIGFEMGAGFSAAKMKGSEYIDRWNGERLMTITATNHCGGVQGGISNGMPLEFRVAFHPVVTIPQPVECLHEDGHLETLTVSGRHDSWHVERATVVVEAMTALCLVNQMRCMM